MRSELAATHVTIDVETEAETALLGRALGELVKPGTVIGLIGTLGAGKTRLVRALAESLDVDPGAIASPTFVLIHEYEGRLPIYHFDTYRLRSADEFEALGAADYFSGDGLCLIEWADLVVDRLPHDTWFLHFEATGPTSRRIKAVLPNATALHEKLNGR